MATPEQVIEFEEARAILRKTLEVSKAAGVSPAVMMGAMGAGEAGGFAGLHGGRARPPMEG